MAKKQKRPKSTHTSTPAPKTKPKAKPKLTPDTRGNNYTAMNAVGDSAKSLILDRKQSMRGLGATLPYRDPSDREWDRKQSWNMVLTTPSYQNFYLWVEEINIDFAMSGSYGQSRYHRQFFPRSFNQPTMNVKGRMMNQYQYNMFSNFIRESHYQALKYSSKQQAGGRTYGAGKYPLPTVRCALKDAGKEKPKNQSNVKGKRQALIFEGYLKNIAAGSQKFEFAPSFQFDIILASSKDTGPVGNIGIYEDQLSAGSAILSWMELFKGNQFGAKNWKQISDQIAADRAKENAAAQAAKTAAETAARAPIDPSTERFWDPMQTLKTGI